MMNILCGVDPITIVWSTVVLLVLALVFGIVLAFLGKKLAVHEDERISKVRAHLSGANCGGCGYAGCDAFAKAVVEGKADVNDCSATSAENKKLIGEVLGVEVSAEDTKIIIACRGGKNAKDKYDYMGYGDCRSMDLLSGGRKQCQWGCLGMGTCASVCHEDAISIGDNGYAEIDQAKCIGCGRCLNSCPKGIIKRIPASAVYYVACANCLRGAKDVKAMCLVGCLGCGLCAKVCPNNAIEMVNNLPVIDYSKCVSCGLCATKCPTKCIVKLED